MKRTVLLLVVIAVVLVLPLAAAAQSEDTGDTTLLSSPPPSTDEAASPDATSASFVVNSTADPGSGVCDAAECTLREALIQANTTPAVDTIGFNIPGAGPHVITLKSALQAVNQPLVLDGFTQPGTTCNTFPTALKIVVNGSGLAGGETGLTISAAGSIVRGIVVQRFPSHGVVVQSSSNSIYCNFVGTNSDGSLDLGNGGIGIFVNNGATNNIYANLISGNGSYGIYAGGASANGNKIYKNRIGTNLAGTSALGNDAEGIMLVDAANTSIGGIDGNLISGNKGYGVSVGGNSAGTVITKNYIGTQLSGNAVLPNTSTGVYAGSANITVGGPNPSDRNVISGNQGSGIVLAGGNAKVLNNYIGVARLGESKLGNTSYGVYVKSSGNQVGQAGQGNLIGGNGQDGIFIESGQNNVVQDNYIGTDNSLGLDLGNAYFGVHVSGGTNSTIGGTGSNTDNHVARNGADGVYVPSAGSQGIRIVGNAIFQNGGLGIDLGENGVTPNDPGDGDTGPNGLQNFPILASAGTNGTATHLTGTLNSKANKSYRVEFFLAGGCDPSGYGEGRGYLGATVVGTNGSGNAGFDVVLPTGVALNAPITATATDPDGNTSEFSQCRNAQAEQVKVKLYLPLTLR